MFRLLPPLLSLLLVSACYPDESISGYAEQSAEYHLIEIDGVPFDASATIAFPDTGEVIGQAPCNKYFATQTAPYPWFALEGIGATRIACENLSNESIFFEALEQMTLAEVSGETLILSNTDGREMIFVAR